MYIKIMTLRLSGCPSGGLGRIEKESVRDSGLRQSIQMLPFRRVAPYGAAP